MTIWALVPAKDPAFAKSRLAPVRTQAERRDLSVLLLEHTVRIAAATPGISHCVVISASAALRSLAQSLGATPLAEDHAAAPFDPRDYEGAPPEPGLNAALQQGARFAQQHGASGVAIVPADLPLLTVEALDALLHALPTGPGIALAPDRHNMGTNALLVRPPLALPFLFGPDSMERHCRAAAERGLRSAIVRHPAFALDLDTPDDLRMLAHGDTDVVDVGAETGVPCGSGKGLR